MSMTNEELEQEIVALQRTLASRRRMDRLDDFARAALTGILAAPSDSVSGDCGPNARANADKAAFWAYEYADAMLAESDRRTREVK